jgi:CHASE2 domain-containing sensor protein
MGRGLLRRLAHTFTLPPRLRTVAIVVAAAVAAMLVALGGTGTGVERQLQMWRDAVRTRPATGKFLLVEVDARSLAALDQWPWPRRYHAQAIQALVNAGASTVAFDVDLSARSNPQDDTELARAIDRSSVPIILPVFRQTASQGKGELIENLPIEPLRPRAQLAAVNIYADEDGLVRSYPYGIAAAGVPRPSIAALLAGSSGKIDTFFPIDGAIRPSTIPRVSFIDLVRGKVPPAIVRGRVALIGATAIEMGDRYPVPQRGVLPGVVIQLLAAETLVQGTSPINGGPLLPLALGILLLPLVLRQRHWRRAAAFALLGLAILSLPLMLELAHLGTVDVVPAGAALTVAAMLSLAGSGLRAGRRARLIDSETQLPNRRALAEEQRPGGQGTLVAIRIANYGDVVGVMGHAPATA